MITAADEYLIHQTPHSFDTVFTSDRNFYDRYFFNGYRRDGSAYFALAMGVYPNLGVIDAAFSVIVDGRHQRFVRASAALGPDRMQTKVGPISVQILEPLRRVRIRVGRNAWGIRADLVLAARSLPAEEPHFLRRDRAAVVNDYTRYTQHCEWSGSLSLDGQSFDVGKEGWWGSRDRSWGVRGVGHRAQGRPPEGLPQFFWTWAPLNFDDVCTLFTVSEYEDGTRWHEDAAVLKPFPEAAITRYRPEHALTFQKGTRRVSGATLTLNPERGPETVIELRPLYHFLMQAIGYGHPSWGHGMWVGPDEVDGGELDLESENPMQNLHVQSIVLATAGRREGVGIFEHIILGPHRKYGFKGLLDPA